MNMRTIIDGVESPQSPAVQYAQIIDDTPPYLYVCEAAIGAISTDAVWRIKRIETVSGVLLTKWADGDSNFNNIANNRTTYTYA